MSDLYLRHIRRHLLRQVATAVEATPTGSLILISGPVGSGHAGVLDALAALLAHRPQTRIPLFPWNRGQPGSLTALLPTLPEEPADPDEGPVLFIDDLQHADPASIRHLVASVRQQGAGTVIASVEDADLEPLASRVFRLAPLTLAETAAHLRALTGHRVPVGTVEVIHGLTGGLPARIDELVAAAPAGHLALPGRPVPLPETWHRRWARTCADLSPGTVRALYDAGPSGLAELTVSHPGAVDEALKAGVLHSIPQAQGRELEFRDVRDAAVVASRSARDLAPTSPVPDVESPEYELHHLRLAEARLAQLDLPGAELYLDECRGRVEPGRQDSLRGYLALYGGRRRQAHSFLDRPSPRPEEAVRGVLLRLADWDLPAVRRRVEEVRRGGDPESAAVVEAEILGLVAEAGLTGRMPDMELQPTNAANRQRLDMVHGWLALTFDDPLTARQKLQPLPGHSPVLGLWQDAWLARTLYVLGEWSEAVRVVERGLATAETHGIQLLEPLLLWTGAQISVMRGDALLSRHYLHRLPVGEDAFLLQRLPSAMGRMIVSATDTDLRPALRAGEQLARIVAGADTQQPGFWPWEDVYAQTLIRAGQIELADQVITSAEERHTPSGLVSLLAKNAVPRATIQLQRGEHEAGLRTFREAVEAISTAPMPAYQARILFEYGKVLRRHGRRSRADDVLSQAAEVFAQMGATAMVERCFAERRISGVGGQRRGPHGLTPQEEQIALRVAEGATNGEVARELTLSTKTVEYHLTRVYRKLGLRSRQELRELLERE